VFHKNKLLSPIAQAGFSGADFGPPRLAGPVGTLVDTLTLGWTALRGKIKYCKSSPLASLGENYSILP